MRVRTHFSESDSEEEKPSQDELLSKFSEGVGYDPDLEEDKKYWENQHANDIADYLEEDEDDLDELKDWADL